MLSATRHLIINQTFYGHSGQNQGRTHKRVTGITS